MSAGLLARASNVSLTCTRSQYIIIIQYMHVQKCYCIIVHAVFLVYITNGHKYIKETNRHTLLIATALVYIPVMVVVPN